MSDRQTVRELIEYLTESPDCCEGMSPKEVLDMPLLISSGNGKDYTSILSTYMVERKGLKVMCIDIGE